MSFVESLERARALLERNRRLSLRAVKLEFSLDDDQLDALVEELVDVQQVAALEGKVLAWLGAAPPRAAAAAGERRQLTVLFCDLVGSTDLSRRIDSEDYRDLIRAFQEAASAVIARYDGHVAQYLGDGLLVYFGLPRAHEDDPERAVRAGLGIVAALDELNPRLESEGKPGVALRVGIHTGPVVVGEMGKRRETFAVGDTVNFAARLQGEAEPNTVLVSSATQRRVQGVFRTRDLGARSLKGLGDVRIHQVVGATGVHSRLDAAPGRLTPLAGRDAELKLLLGRWTQATGGLGQAVLVSGEPGLGKSRLLRALRERLAAESHEWLEGQCSAYRQGSAFHPLVEPIGQAAGFDAADPPGEKLRRLEAAVRDAGLPVPETVPLLASILSLPRSERHPQPEYSPELRPRKTFDALSDWLLALSRRRPLLLLVEDLHWCDPSTLEFLTLLLERCPSGRVLTLLSFRSGFEPPWPPRPHVAHLGLERLEPRQAKRLLETMPLSRPLPRAVRERIVERADGVPLFLEELARMVLDSGLDEDGEGDRLAQAIPGTLQDSLMARLDRLGRGKEVAQVAAVLGREFPHALLRAISRLGDAQLADGLKRLIDAELLHAQSSPPHAAYSFKHTLIQDTAYQSLLRSARREVHAATARALEEHFPERAAQEPEVVARHYDEAGQAELAIDRYRRAASRAKQQSANEEATRHLTRALELLRALPAERERDRVELDLQLAIGVPLYVTRGYADADYGQSLERARALATQLEVDAELFNVWMGLYLHHQVAGELARAEACARQALTLAGPSAGPTESLIASAALSQALYLQGDFVPALAYLDQALALFAAPERGPASRDPSGRHLQLPYHVRALCLWALGYPDQALELCHASLESARRLGPPFNVASACIYSGWIHQKRGERARALERAQEALEICERLGFSWLPWAVALRGSVRDAAEQGELAVADIERGIAALQSAGTRGWVPHCFTALAEAFCRLERHGDALDALDRGLACARETGQRYEDVELLRLRGEILAADGRGEAGAAERALEAALDAARRQRARSLELRAATSLARLWRRRGQDAQARALLAPVHAGFGEGLDTRDWQDANALLEDLA